jgi:hypothetical protein
MVYNRSPERVDEFKAYAKENEVEEGHYEVVKDLKEIGEKWVLLLILQVVIGFSRAARPSSKHDSRYTKA